MTPDDWKRRIVHAVRTWSQRPRTAAQWHELWLAGTAPLPMEPMPVGRDRILSRVDLDRVVGIPADVSLLMDALCRESGSPDPWAIVLERLPAGADLTEAWWMFADAALEMSERSPYVMERQYEVREQRALAVADQFRSLHRGWTRRCINDSVRHPHPLDLLPSRIEVPDDASTTGRLLRALVVDRRFSPVMRTIEPDLAVWAAALGDAAARLYPRN